MTHQGSSRRPNRRQVAAAATRSEILATARRLFADQGYPATTINQVAEEAGVAVQTVYSSIGSKAALVLALNDLIDAESGVAEVAERVATATDPAEVLRSGVRLTRQLNERCGDIVRVLLAAEPADPEVAAAVRDGMRRHHEGVELLCRRLTDLEALAPGTDTERVTATLALMTSPASWRQLTEESGWSFDHAEKLLVESLSTLLLRHP